MAVRYYLHQDTSGFCLSGGYPGCFFPEGFGYRVSRNLDVSLTLGALRIAIAQRHPDKGIIHHSDQGVQYSAEEYVQELKAHGFVISMSRKGNPYDNALAESFLKTLKAEEVYLWDYETLEDARKRIPFFL